MKISSDYKDLLKNLNAAGVRYLIVGGYAVMIHSEPRYTKDLDIWVDRSTQNAQALFDALARFGAPLRDIQSADFCEPDVFYQLGVDPVRVDVMTSVPGLDFEDAWSRRIEVDFDGELGYVLGAEDLRIAKNASGRKRDRADRTRLSRKRSK